MEALSVQPVPLRKRGDARPENQATSSLRAAGGEARAAEGPGRAGQSASFLAEPPCAVRTPSSHGGNESRPTPSLPSFAGPSRQSGRSSPPTRPASGSETCVIEKRDAGAGETVKREKGAGAAGLEGAAVAAGADSRAGACGTPWSHWNLAPAKRPEVKELRGLQRSFFYCPRRCQSSPGNPSSSRRVAPPRSSAPPRPLREDAGPGPALEPRPETSLGLFRGGTEPWSCPRGPALEAPPTTRRPRPRRQLTLLDRAAVG